MILNIGLYRITISISSYRNGLLESDDMDCYNALDVLEKIIFFVEILWVILEVSFANNFAFTAYYYLNSFMITDFFVVMMLGYER